MPVAVGVERLLEKRNVFVEKLFLQILGSGRNDDALARSNHRQQVGQGLAGAGAGFDDQVSLFGERFLDRLRHLKLPAAEFIGGMGLRQHAPGREEIMQGTLVGAYAGALRGPGWEVEGTESL